jgi:hypothetical protein
VVEYQVTIFNQKNMKIPNKVPEKGFYYHYKHDPKGSINNYAYEVIGVGVHSEDDCRPEDANMVVYLPLYEAAVFKAGKLFDLRPLEMWMGDVEKEGKTIRRFTKIVDEEVISKLNKIKEKMYKI